MARWEQPADDPYSALDHGDGLGGNLSKLPVEVRREFMDADTQIEPHPYQDRPSRHVSFWVALTLGLAVITGLIVAMIGLQGVGF